ncbi:hypothetical protein ACP275_04G082000 [Erythranthe tilingii]
MSIPEFYWGREAFKSSEAHSLSTSPLSLSSILVIAPSCFSLSLFLLHVDLCFRFEMCPICVTLSSSSHGPAVVQSPRHSKGWEDIIIGRLDNCVPSATNTSS